MRLFNLDRIFSIIVSTYTVLHPSVILGQNLIDVGTLSTRAMSVAGAYVSIADDSSAFMTNPAGVSRNAEERRLYLATRFYDKLSRWGLNAAVTDGVTEHPLHWGFGFDTTHNQNLQREFYSLTTSYSFRNIVLIGMNHHFDIFRETAAVQKKWLFALDAGILIFATDFLAIGAATSRFYRSKKDAALAPFKYSAGISFNFRTLRASIDVERNQSQRLVVLKAGVEAQPVKFLMLRGGYFTNRQRTEYGYTLGTGINPSERFGLDIGILDQLKSSYKVFSGGIRLLI